MRLPDFARQMRPAAIGTWADSLVVAFQRTWPKKLSLSKRSAVSAFEFLLVVGCAHQVALMFWAVATPSPQSTAVSPTLVAASAPFQVPQNLRLTTQDIFQRSIVGKTQGDIGASAPATTLNLQLFGMRSLSGASGGSAIIRRPDGSQDVFFVGQSIIDGVILERIRSDHVVIRRMGLLEGLYLDQARVPVQPVLDDQPVVVADDMPRRRLSATASELFSAIQVTPERTGAGTAGLAVRPGADPSLFTEAGFEAGDVLLAVNGQTTAQLTSLPAVAQSLQGASRFTIAVDRKGKSLTYQLLIDR